MKAYSTHRPIGMGTYPRGYQIEEIVNFDSLTWVEEIKHHAFGYIVFASDVPECVLSDYELATPIDTGEDFNTALSAIVRAYRRGASEDKIDKMLLVAESKGIDIEALWGAIDKELAN